MDELLRFASVKSSFFEYRVKFYLAISINKFSVAEITFVAKGARLMLRLPLFHFHSFTANMTYTIYKANIFANLRLE